MINRVSNPAWALVLVTTLVITGCQQGYKKEVPAYNPLTDPNFIVSDYASRAIEAAGRQQAWTNAKEVHLDAVVTFYRHDGSFYLTEQHYEIYPWANSIRISAQEPQGKFVCQLLRGQFTVLEAPRAAVLPAVIDNRDLSEAILNITTAPVRLLDTLPFTKLSNPVKMEGLWYYPIERNYSIGQAPEANNKQAGAKPVEPYWSKAVFYQSTNSFLVDVIWLADIGKEKYLAVRGYDYNELEKRSIRVPAKIEIFKSNANADLQQRLVKIELK